MKDEEYSFACTIIDQWHSLDFSVSINHELIEIKNLILQSIPDRKLLLEIQNKLEIHAKRTIRHRKLLEAEWRTLKTKFGMAETVLRIVLIWPNLKHSSHKIKYS